MKLGKDFWFWLRLIYIVLKAILEGTSDAQGPKLTAGNRAFDAVLGTLIEENEDDARKATDLAKLKGK